MCGWSVRVTSAPARQSRMPTRPAAARCGAVRCGAVRCGAASASASAGLSERGMQRCSTGRQQHQHHPLACPPPPARPTHPPTHLCRTPGPAPWRRASCRRAGGAAASRPAQTQLATPPGRRRLGPRLQASRRAGGGSGDHHCPQPMQTNLCGSSGGGRTSASHPLTLSAMSPPHTHTGTHAPVRMRGGGGSSPSRGAGRSSSSGRSAWLPRTSCRISTPTPATSNRRHSR